MCIRDRKQIYLTPDDLFGRFTEFLPLLSPNAMTWSFFLVNLFFMLCPPSCRKQCNSEDMFLPISLPYLPLFYRNIPFRHYASTQWSLLKHYQVKKIKIQRYGIWLPRFQVSQQSIASRKVSRIQPIESFRSWTRIYLEAWTTKIVSTKNCIADTPGFINIYFPCCQDARIKTVGCIRFQNTGEFLQYTSLLFNGLVYLSLRYFPGTIES